MNHAQEYTLVNFAKTCVFNQPENAGHVPILGCFLMGVPHNFFGVCLPQGSIWDVGASWSTGPTAGKVILLSTAPVMGRCYSS